MGVTFLEDRWLPKSVLCLRDYNRHKFFLDLIAGVTVGLVALPLAMAFALSGTKRPHSVAQKATKANSSSLFI